MNMLQTMLSNDDTCTLVAFIGNKKMQHGCGVTYSIALSYQFQNTTILVNLFQLY